jgi:hypothetical protein
MRHYYKHIIIVLLAIVIFVPFYPVTIVPEWELLFVNKDGTPAASISVKQIWKHYSYEWFGGEHTNEGLQADSTGYIKLPAREIRVSLFKIISSTILDTVNINPHASSGPSSYILCEGRQDCSVVSYKKGIEQPQRVIILNSW